MNTLCQYVRTKSFVVRALMLAIFEAALLALLAPFLWYFGAGASFAAAGLAAGLCTAGALLSFWIQYIFRDPKSALIGVLSGMAINMAVPLLFGVVIHLRGGPLSQAGFLYYLLLFYLLTLAVKTMFTLQLLHQRAACHNESIETVS